MITRLSFFLSFSRVYLYVPSSVTLNRAIFKTGNREFGNGNGEWESGGCQAGNQGGDNREYIEEAQITLM